MSEYDIEELENSLELPIGAKFYFRNILFEVVEANEGRVNPWGCSKCAFNKRDEEEVCFVMNCDSYRRDQKCIYFKEVEEQSDEAR